MNIIIIGSGKVGSTIAEQLNDEGNHSIVMIDLLEDKLESLENRIDIMTLKGNGSSAKTLLEAGVKNTDLVISVTDRDTMNVCCCLMAKKLGAKHTIARVRNPEFSKDISLIKEELGLSLSINPELITANEIARLIKYPAAIEIDRFARGGIELYTLKCPENSRIVGKSIVEIAKKKTSDFQICAVERDGEVFIPTGDFVMQALDKFYILSTPENAYNMFKQFDITMKSGRTALIIGGSRIATYLAKFLIESKISVKIVEINKEKCEEISAEIPEATVICGDALDKEMLLEEGLENVDCVASLTGLDEENIILSLYASSVSDAKIITKINKISFDNIFDNMEIGSIVAPKYLTSEYVLQYVRAMENSKGSNIEALYKIVGGKAEALEFKVKNESAVTNTKLADLKLKDNLLIGTIKRDNDIFVPSGNDSIQVGDTVIIVTTQKKLQDLSDILK